MEQNTPNLAHKYIITWNQFKIFFNPFFPTFHTPRARSESFEIQFHHWIFINFSKMQLQRARVGKLRKNFENFIAL